MPFLVTPTGVLALSASNDGLSDLQEIKSNELADAFDRSELKIQSGFQYVDVPSYGQVLATTRKVAGVPAAVLLVKSDSEVLGDWRQSLVLLSLLIILALGSAAVFCGIMVRQIGQTQRLADQTRTARAHAELMGTAGQCGSWMWNLTERRIRWSTTMFALLGHRRRDASLSMHKFKDYVHPEDRSVVESFLAISDAAPGFEATLRLKHAQGHWIWVRLRGQIEESFNPHRRYIVGIANEISELKKAEARVKTIEERLKECLDSLTGPFAMFDTRGTLLTSNRAYRELDALLPTSTRGMARPSKGSLAGAWMRIPADGRPLVPVFGEIDAYWRPGAHRPGSDPPSNRKRRPLPRARLRCRRRWPALTIPETDSSRKRTNYRVLPIGMLMKRGRPKKPIGPNRNSWPI